MSALQPRMRSSDVRVRLFEKNISVPMRKYIPESAKPHLRRYRRWLRALDPRKRGREIDALYALLYQLAHDRENALVLTASQTLHAFSHQWKTLSHGKYLLSDPWFKENVDRILVEEEIQLRREWFKGKTVLDCGSGNGRWTYGFARLGAHVTAVDANESGVAEARKALEGDGLNAEFHVSELENLDSVLGDRKFDLVFCWGVLHHCSSFNRSLASVIRRSKPGGVVYLYLYGSETIPPEEEMEYFKQRVIYNSLRSDEDRLRWLRKRAGGDESRLHNLHDFYAPLINRRMSFEEVEPILVQRGFQDITRTIDHTELYIRAVNGDPSPYRDWFLAKKKAPYWFRHHG